MPKKGEKLSDEQKQKMQEGRKRLQQQTTESVARPNPVATAGERAGRRKRAPLGVRRSKLTVQFPIPNHHLHWINDDKTRLHDAIQGGYEFVSEAEVGMIGDPDITPGNDDLGMKVSKTVGTKDDHSPMVAYLMKIPTELYEQDQAEKQADIDEKEKAIYRGEHSESVENKYIPAEGMKISHTN